MEIARLCAQMQLYIQEEIKLYARLERRRQGGLDTPSFSSFSLSLFPHTLVCILPLCQLMGVAPGCLCFPPSLAPGCLCLNPSLPRANARPPCSFQSSPTAPQFPSLSLLPSLPLLSSRPCSSSLTACFSIPNFGKLSSPPLLLSYLLHLSLCHVLPIFRHRHHHLHQPPLQILTQP